MITHEIILNAFVSLTFIGALFGISGGLLFSFFSKK